MNSIYLRIFRTFFGGLFFFFSGLYLLTLPFYTFFMAIPGGMVDALLPLETALCSFVSGVNFGLFALFCYRIFRMVREDET